jgi:uncharacterized protein
MSVFQVLQRAARAVAVTVTLVAFGPVAHAQSQQPSAASMQAAKQLIAVTHATTVFNPLIAGVVEQAKLLFLQQNPGLGKDLNDVAVNIRKELQPRFGEITNEVALLYAKNFTEQELKEILKFYKSPTGQKLLQKQPKVIDSSMEFAQNWSNKLSDEVIEKMREEMKKKGHNL